MYTTKKVIMKNYPQQKSKKMRLRFLLLLKTCKILSKASKKSPPKKKTPRKKDPIPWRKVTNPHLLGFVLSTP